MYADANEVAEEIDVDPARVLPAGEAAEVLGVSEATVYNRGSRGDLDCYETEKRKVFVVPDDRAERLDDSLEEKLEAAEQYNEQLEEQIDDLRERLEAMDRDDPTAVLEEKLDLERSRRRQAEDEVLSLNNRLSMMKKRVDAANSDEEVDEWKSRAKKAKAKLHNQNNELQAMIGTLWCEFCEDGPIADDAFNGASYPEIAKMCADAFRSTASRLDEQREENEKLRDRVAQARQATEYVKKHQSPSVVRIACSAVRFVASRFLKHRD